MNLAEKAMAIAMAAHANHTDKAGAAYMGHVLRVRDTVAAFGEEAEAVALLHDVIEDCPEWSYDRLREEGFPEHIIVAVDAVTRRKAENESYDAYTDRAMRNELAAVVKVADMLDNANLGRLASITQADIDRTEKYLRCLRKMVKNRDGR